LHESGHHASVERAERDREYLSGTSDPGTAKLRVGDRRSGLSVYLAGEGELPEGFDLASCCKEIGFPADRAAQH
jgi:hypothetical protein